MWFNISKFLMTVLLRAAGYLPLKVHHFNARWIAFLVEKVIKYRVDVVDRNLRNSFPEKSDEQRLEIRHEFYIHFAKIFTQAIWFGSCRNPRRLKRADIVRIKNPGTINSLYENAPGTVVMYSHAGNWELLGGIENYTDKEICFKEDNFCVVYRRLSSRLWDEIMREIRFAPLKDRKNFQGYLESKAVIRHALQHRGEKKIYNMNTDQRPYFAGSGQIKLKFMNQECETMAGAASIAHKLSFSVAFQRMVEDREGHYTIEYIPICEDASKMSVEDIMFKYYELLEKDIREQPYNYLWTHKRWW